MTSYIDALRLLLDSDIYTYQYFLQEDVCRFCWTRNASINITETTENGVKNELLDKIRDCLDVNLTEQSFPSKTCAKCCDQIESFYNFKYFCKETDKKLNEIRASGCEKSENVDKSTQIIPNLKLENHDFTDFETDTLNEIELPNSDTACFEIVTKKKKKRKSLSKSTQNSYKPKKSATYCNICHIDLESKETFSYHNSQQHGIEQDGAVYKCFGCEKRFKKRRSRLSHEVHFCKALKEGYKCSICDRYLPQRRTYEAHMRSHRKNITIELPDNIFKCVKCNEVFDSRDTLKKHMCAAHDTKKNFVCESCGRVFSRQDYLHKHKLTHTGIKQHVCPHCGFRATQRSSLTVHIRKHTGERPYSCDVCPQRCISSSNLRAHRRRHLGVKTYECTICPKKFGYKISLEEHISTTHERSQSHPCQDCGATYTRIRGLRRHLLAKHGKQYKKENSTSIYGILEEPGHSKIDLKIDKDNGLQKESVCLLKVDDVEKVYEIKDAQEFILKGQDGIYTLA